MSLINIKQVEFKIFFLIPVVLFATSCSDLKLNGASAMTKFGATIQDCADCPVMVVVPAGQFVMGSPPDEAGRSPDETQHTVTIAKPFAVGKYGVTFDEWAACVADKACVDVKDEGWGRGRRPVINVSWDESQAYTVWLAKKTGKTYRLLSEAEMEYAARAGSKGMRFWGDVPNDSCLYANVFDISGKRDLKQAGENFECDDSFGFSAPVGSYKPNAFGLYDMLGNVLNWTADCYHDSYEGAPVDGSAWMTGDCARHSRRGGSMHSLQLALRVAKRGKASGTSRGDYLGLRVALTLP